MATSKLASFSDCIYSRDYEVYFGNVVDTRDWYAETYKISFESPNGTSDAEDLDPGALAFYDSRREVYVMLFSKNPAPDIIAHECFHVTGMVMRHLGHRCGTANDEPEAYLLTFLVRMVHECKKKPPKTPNLTKSPKKKREIKKKTKKD